MQYILAAVSGLACMMLAGLEPIAVWQGKTMLDGDYPNAAAAFALFIRDHWHWPLGANPHFGGVNVFFSDAAPWLALLGRLLYQLSGWSLPFAALIPVNFVLFAVMAWRLSGCATQEVQTRWLITLLLACNIIMPVRVLGAQHIALASWWVVLWAMCAVPDATVSRWWRRWECLAVVVVAVWSHAYPAAMAVTLMLVMLLYQRRWVAALLMVLLPPCLLWMMGVFEHSHALVGGAQAYSVDWLAPLGSLGWALIPHPWVLASPAQRDVTGWLGSGVWLLLLAGGMVSIFRQWHQRGVHLRDSALMTVRLRLLLLGSGLLGLFAMAFTVRIGGHLLLQWPIPSALSPLYERFRVTGRFVTPLIYVLVIIAALFWSRLARDGWLRQRYWWGITLLALALQAGDVVHAGFESAPQALVQQTRQQRQAVEQLLAGVDWSGQVYRKAGVEQLEQQRMLDWLLVEEGATDFNLAHGARLTADRVAQRSGVDRAGPGDLLILPEEQPPGGCQRRTAIRQFVLCLQ